MKRKFISIILALYLPAGLLQVAFAAEKSPVRIAVIDTGISSAAISPENIAEGYNYICPGDGSEDKTGHGTAVASLIVGSEKAGIEGVCPEAVLVPLVYATKTEDGKTVKGDTAMVAQAIYDAIDVYNCRIINISSGGTSDSKALSDAVTYAEERGVLVVSCAGNENDEHPGTVFYPGGYESVLCVGSASEDNAVSYFSQRNKYVDILALGSGLRVSSIKGSAIRAFGTSYATACVSGAAARLLEVSPTLSPKEIRDILCESATDIGEKGYDADSGWGILNLNLALEKAASHCLPFLDVKIDDWYYDGVKFCYENGLMSGTGQNSFAPDAHTTRAMLWTILAREAKQDTVEGTAEDVRENAGEDTGSSEVWYEKAQQWAKENGISDGTNPQSPITREQLVTILYRYAIQKGMEVSVGENAGESMSENAGEGTSKSAAEGSSILSYKDADDVAEYAIPAMQWACEAGIIKGSGKNTLHPKDNATRAEVAVILKRFLQQD